MAINAGCLDPNGAFSAPRESICRPEYRFDPFWGHATDFSPDRWEAKLLPKLLRLWTYTEGWDGHEGKAINADACWFTLIVLNDVLRPTTPLPQIVPTASGAIQLEWHEHGIDLEVKISGAYKCEVFFEDFHHPEVGPIELVLEADLTPLIRLVDEIASR